MARISVRVKVSPGVLSELSAGIAQLCSRSSRVELGLLDGTLHAFVLLVLLCEASFVVLVARIAFGVGLLCGLLVCAELHSILAVVAVALFG
jgi:hypothetical protein